MTCWLASSGYIDFIYCAMNVQLQRYNVYNARVTAVTFGMSVTSIIMAEALANVSCYNVSYSYTIK